MDIAPIMNHGACAPGAGTFGHCIGVCASLSFAITIGGRVGEKRVDVLQGTLDLMILRTLFAMGPMHGFGIARRLEQISENALQLNEGTVYTSLLRLQQAGWIASK